MPMSIKIDVALNARMTIIDFEPLNRTNGRREFAEAVGTVVLEDASPAGFSRFHIDRDRILVLESDSGTMIVREYLESSEELDRLAEIAGLLIEYSSVDQNQKDFAYTVEAICKIESVTDPSAFLAERFFDLSKLKSPDVERIEGAWELTFGNREVRRHLRVEGWSDISLEPLLRVSLSSFHSDQNLPSRDVIGDHLKKIWHDIPELVRNLERAT